MPCAPMPPRRTHRRRAHHQRGFGQVVEKGQGQDQHSETADAERRRRDHQRGNVGGSVRPCGGAAVRCETRLPPPSVRVGASRRAALRLQPVGPLTAACRARPAPGLACPPHFHLRAAGQDAAGPHKGQERLRRRVCAGHLQQDHGRGQNGQEAVVAAVDGGAWPIHRKRYPAGVEQQLARQGYGHLYARAPHTLCPGTHPLSRAKGAGSAQHMPRPSPVACERGAVASRGWARKHGSGRGAFPRRQGVTTRAVFARVRTHGFALETPRSRACLAALTRMPARTPGGARWCLHTVS